MLNINKRLLKSRTGLLPSRNVDDRPHRTGRRIRDYSISDASRFIRACVLAEKINASIDDVGFRQIVDRHKTEGWDSYRYFNKRAWLRSKVMRVLELGLDRRKAASILDLGCGAGYFLYTCRYFGHDVHGLDLPDYDFYNEMIAHLRIPRTGFKIEPYKPLPNLGRRFDVISAHYICFNGHKSPALWGPREWHFLLDDLKNQHLTPNGTIALEFNEEPKIGFYTEDLRNFFREIGARMFRGRVLIQAD